MSIGVFRIIAFEFNVRMFKFAKFKREWIQNGGPEIYKFIYHLEFSEIENLTPDLDSAARKKPRKKVLQISNASK